MSNFSDAELRERRLIDKLVREALQETGIKPANPKSFDELVANGDLKAAECNVLSRDMVSPNWLELAAEATRSDP